MVKLGIIILFLSSISTNAQKVAGTYIWKTIGYNNDSIVSVITISDDFSLTQTEYVKSKSEAITNYKSWKKTSREATLVKKNKFYQIVQLSGDKILNGGLIKIKRKQIWFYGYRNKDMKLVRCKPLTYKKSQLP